MKRLILLAVIAFVTLSNFAQDAQWRGPSRNGHYPETGLLKSWPEEGPEMIFMVDSIGTGWSSAVEYDGIIYVTGKFDQEDHLTAIDHEGRKLWQVAFGESWDKSFRDTRSTPAIMDGKVYLISGTGEVVCMDAKSGDMLWKVDAREKFGGLNGKWGVAESPLIVDNKVICTTGGMKTTMVALDKSNGEPIWTTESISDSSAYVSPTLIEFGGKDIIVNVLSNHVVGVDAANGTILWKVRYFEICNGEKQKRSFIINAVSPIFHEGELYVTSGYDHVGVKFRLVDEGNAIEQVWTDTILDTHLGGVLYHEGYIYGANWINNRVGEWCSINWETGEPGYVEKWHTKGSIITADDMLYVYDERHGNVGLVEINPDDFNVISSFRITEGQGTYWAHPTIYNKKLLIRHGHVLMAYDIADKSVQP